MTAAATDPVIQGDGQTQVHTLTNEIEKIAQGMMDESSLLDEIVTSLEAKIAKLFGEPPETLPTGEPADAPGNLFASFWHAHSHAQTHRARLEKCCQRL